MADPTNPLDGAVAILESWLNYGGEEADFDAWVEGVEEGTHIEDDVYLVVDNKTGADRFYAALAAAGFTMRYVMANEKGWNALDLGAGPGVRPSERELFWWGSDERPHYLASNLFDVLHELSHWMLAKPEDRKRLDFGLGEPDDAAAPAELDVELVAKLLTLVLALQFDLAPMFMATESSLIADRDEVTQAALERLHQWQKSNGTCKPWLRKGWVQMDGELF